MHPREIRCWNAELARHLRHGLVGAVSMQRRGERVSASQRGEDAHGLWSPEVHGQMRRELVRQKEGLVGLRLLDEVERLGPAADEHAANRVWQVVEQRREGR